MRSAPFPQRKNQRQQRQGGSWAWNHVSMLDVLVIVIAAAFFIGCALFVRGSARIIGEGQSGDEVRGEARGVVEHPDSGTAVLVERQSDEGAFVGGAVAREPVDTPSTPVAEGRAGDR
jgi:hypothetical protein